MAGFESGDQVTVIYKDENGAGVISGILRSVTNESCIVDTIGHEFAVVEILAEDIIEMKGMEE